MMSVEMKDSGIVWIGEIPKHWEISLLSSLFFEHSLKNIGMQENNLLSLSYGKIIRKNIGENGGLLPASFEGYNIISPNDIVFRLTDLQNDKRSLRTALCTERGIITSAYITIRQRHDDVSARYFHYLLHSYDECKVFYGIGNGVRQGMIYQDLRKLLLVLPPTKEEQSQIANFLDKKCAEIDELIALQDQMIAQLTTYKQAIITETVTKGLDPNVKMKDSDVEWIGEIPEHWSLKRIKNESTLNPTINVSVLDDDSIVSYMPMECLRNGIIKQNSGKYYDVKHYTPFQEEDIVLAKVTPCFENGNIAIARNLDNKVGFGTSEIFVIRCKDTMHNDFMFYYLQCPYVKNMGVASMTGTGGLKRVNPNVLNTMFLVYPPLSEQQSIANYLDQKCNEIDELISVKKDKIEKLKAYKKSVIFEYVTGKKQVN